MALSQLQAVYEHIFEHLWLLLLGRMPFVSICACSKWCVPCNISPAHNHICSAYASENVWGPAVDFEANIKDLGFVHLSPFPASIH